MHSDHSTPHSFSPYCDICIMMLWGFWWVNGDDKLSAAVHMARNKYYTSEEDNSWRNTKDRGNI